MSFDSFLETMKRKGLGFCVEGFINIEGGTASVSTEIFPTSECDCPTSGLGVPPLICDVCGRGPGNTVSCVAGSGDGVYVILGIYPLNQTKTRLGALAVFDWGYELANTARARVEVNNSMGFDSDEFKSMGGDGLVFSSDLLRSFDLARPIHHGSLQGTGKVFFSDVFGHRNADYAIADVQLDSDSLEVYIFGPEEDPYSETLSSEDSGPDFEARKIAMFETLGLTPSEPTYFPQILMVLDSDTAKQFDFSDQLPMTDWDSAGVHGMARMGTSHLEPQHVSTYWVNALLARAKFRLTLMKDEDADESEDEDPLDQMMSWALLGEITGDTDATKLIDELGLRELASIPDYRDSVLDLRGWDDVPVKESEEAQQFTKSSDGLNSSSGLTKSSSKSGLGLDASETQIGSKSASNFCANCGLKFESADANFCQSCGTKRL